MKLMDKDKQLDAWNKQDERDVDDAIKACFEHKSTRKFLWWLLEIGNAMGHNPFTGNALSTAYNCGALEVGQQVMKRIISVSPKGFTELLKEIEDERRTRTESLTRPNADAGADSDYDTDPWADTDS